jgi:hypothetical protein
LPLVDVADLDLTFAKVKIHSINKPFRPSPLATNRGEGKPAPTGKTESSTSDSVDLNAVAVFPSGKICAIGSLGISECEAMELKPLGQKSRISRQILFHPKILTQLPV